MLQESEVDLLRIMFEKYVYPCVDWVMEGIEGDDLVSVGSGPSTC